MVRRNSTAHEQIDHDTLIIATTHPYPRPDTPRPFPQSDSPHSSSLRQGASLARPPSLSQCLQRWCTNRGEFIAARDPRENDRHEVHEGKRSSVRKRTHKEQDAKYNLKQHCYQSTTQLSRAPTLPRSSQENTPYLHVRARPRSC